MPEIPADLKYSADHLWIRLVDGTSRVRAGVTDFAQQSLGDVVEVTPPRAGDSITAGDACGDIESVKSVSDLIAPITGTVRDRNDDLAETPEVVNSDPYGRGWIFDAEIDPATLDRQLGGLMDAGAYRELTGA
jgi:glycine cleavage system H protein